MGEQSQVKPPARHLTLPFDGQHERVAWLRERQGCRGPLDGVIRTINNLPHRAVPIPGSLPNVLDAGARAGRVSHGASREQITTKAGPEDSPGVPESGLVPTHDAANSVPISPPAMTHGRPPRFMDRSLIGDGFLVKERHIAQAKASRSRDRSVLPRVACRQ